jgi:predicted phage terminase large subunit-like protein
LNYSNLSIEELEQYETLKKWQYASETLEGFVDIMFYETYGIEYKWNFHHRIICETLTSAMYSTTPRRIMIFVPPQYGKTELSSRMLPAWALSQWPDLKIGVASYGGEIASGFVRDTQKILATDLYRKLFPETRLSSDIRNKENREVVLREKQLSNFFEISGRRGSYYGVGVSGSLTSKSLDFLIIDDLYKDMMQADSLAYRKQVNSWYPTVAKTRLSKNGHIIIVYTRWHIDDLAGVLLKQQELDKGVDQWEVIHFPFIAEGKLHPKDPRELGEPIWPEHKEDKKAAEAVRKTTSAREFSAIYQQRPIISEGNIIRKDYINYYTYLPENIDYYFIVGDLRFKKSSDTGSYVCFQYYAVSGDDIYLIDQVRGRWGYVQSKNQFVSFCKRHPLAKLKYLENKANAPAMEDDLKDIVRGIKFYNPIGDKVARVHYVEDIFESGCFHTPEKASWKREYEEELFSFPQSPNDDQVDCTSMALAIAKDRVKKLVQGKKLASLRPEQLVGRW